MVAVRIPFGVCLLGAISLMLGCGDAQGVATQARRDAGGGVRVDLDFNVCPKFDFSMVRPHELGPRDEAAVVVNAEDAEESRITYRWRASSGSFSKRTEPSTTYSCGDLGRQTLTATATDDEGCSTERVLEVVCLED